MLFRSMRHATTFAERERETTIPEATFSLFSLSWRQWMKERDRKRYTWKVCSARSESEEGRNRIDLMRQTRVGVTATGHGKVCRVTIALPDLRRGGQLAVNLGRLGESVVAGQRPRLRVQLHGWEPLDERIVGGGCYAGEKSDAVVVGR